MIKQYNKRQKKSEMKIKGYGKMKKQQLLANVLEKIEKMIWWILATPLSKSYIC